MNPHVLDLITASPEVLVLLMGCLILLFDLFVKDPSRTLTFVLTQLTFVGAAVLTLFTSTGEVVYAFNGLYVDDLMGDLLKLVLYLTVIVTLFYARPYVLQRPDLRRGEFYILVLFATLGMMVMISANHLLTIYLGIELLSLSVYALVAMNRDSVASTEAAMKYFILGALASGLLLYGMSMVYGATGTLSIPEISDALVANASNPTVLIFGLVFLVSGIAFKLGVVPFHMWVPDVYQGSPTAITMLIGGAPKLAAFAITILTHLGLITGQTAGLAVLLSYLTGFGFGPVFFAVNLPFYWLGYRRMGLGFTLKTFAAVALMSGLSMLMPTWVEFGALSTPVGAILFGAISGSALLALFRHGASLGGVGILALILQDKTGFRAGQTQLIFDAALFAAALAVLPAPTVMWSALGALVVNLVITINHRRDRYIAT